jgi:hypothetical protein
LSVDAWADACNCPQCGRESCEEHLPPDADQSSTSTAANRPRLIVQRALDVINAPRPVEIIEGIAWADCLSVLVSESGIGKTFVLLDAAAAVSDGVPWHGRAVRQGSVLYLSYEGDAIGVRLRALRDVAGRRLEHVYVVRGSDPLSPRLTREGEERSIGETAATATLEALVTELQTTGRPPIALSVIDTVRASLSGSEDSSEHVAAYLRAVRRLMRRTPGAGVVLAHHAGWQDGDTQRKRERGSSAWRGNSDAVMYLEGGAYEAERGEASLTLRALKVRDDERLPPLHLIRRRVELLEAVSSDLRRGPVTSCVISRDVRTRADREAEQAQVAETVNRELDLAVLGAMRRYPSATSIARLRPYVGQRTELVSAAVGRILRANLAVEGKRGEPYTLTEAGVACLNGAGS